MERHAENPQHSRDEPPAPRPRSRHQVHRRGSYLDFDADFDVGYGDGTPESLADLLWQPPTDHWQADRNVWGAAHDCWDGPEEERS